MGGGPTEILPPKKQAVVERLRRRIESYRKHQNDCVPRFDHSFNGVIEQNVQDTLLLKRRFLENKAKRTVKKSEKKPNDNSIQNTSNNLQKYGTKRGASEDVESNTADSNYISNKTGSSSNGPQVDGPPTKSSNPSNNKENLTKFSVEIVQQLEFTTSAANSQISANVTVKAMNTCIKSDPVNSPPSSPRPANTPQQVIECKREPDMKFVDLEECAAALEKDAVALHGNSSFPGFTDLIGDDTSDAFNDLISDISDFNTEFMKDFDFDNSDNKTSNLNCNNNNINNNNSNSNNTQTQSINQMPNSPAVVDESIHQIKTESKDLSHLHPSCSQSRINFHPGLEISKTELSPAAQTLKHMAEQHQVKVAALGVNYGQRLSNYGPVSTQNNANNSPYTQELKQEAYSNNGQNQNTQNNQGSPGPQNQQTRSGSPGSHRYKTNFNNFTSRSTSGPQRQQQQQAQNSSLHATQTQQIHAQGHQIQVSLAQNIAAELKSGTMTLGAQQGAFFSGSTNSEQFCSVSQSQTLNFSQHNLRARNSTVPRHPSHNIRNHLPVVMEVINPNSHLGGVRQELSNKSHNVQYPLPRFAQPRMILQPMPPSGPLLRGSYMNTVAGPRGNLQTGKPLRDMAQQNENISWKHMVLHPPRNSSHFHPNHGVTFSSNENQISGGQTQHIGGLSQHPSLGFHQINPSMSVRINMSQNVSTNSIFTSGGKPSSNSLQDHQNQIQTSQNYPPNSTYNSSPLIFSNSSYGHPLLHHVQQANNSNNLTTPPDFNLDFLEQLPTDNSAHFSDQDLINSLESSGNFNFQDIL
ncbi:hypothetical protein O3M35_004454 [Rhynocoris fuscipes]|uniref:Neurogenic mastermind-like N-terminal domain-containing protein n=1 Tax=Rhynocoris fuscipes TaxID=488301 RepID=A0AAW1CGN6_9HEMI